MRPEGREGAGFEADARTEVRDRAESGGKAVGKQAIGRQQKFVLAIEI